MSKANFSENTTLDANLRGVDPAFRANASRWIALYTADPGETGTAITSEATFGGYARVAVTASSGFTAASLGSSSNTGLIQFPECTSGSNTITHLGIVTTASGAGDIIYSGALTASRNVSSGIQLQVAISALVVNED
jgi:acetyl-CoA carboxylase beta subunit